MHARIEVDRRSRSAVGILQSSALQILVKLVETIQIKQTISLIKPQYWQYSATQQKLIRDKMNNLTVTMKTKSVIKEKPCAVWLTGDEHLYELCYFIAYLGTF